MCSGVPLGFLSIVKLHMKSSLSESSGSGLMWSFCSIFLRPHFHHPAVLLFVTFWTKVHQSWAQREAEARSAYTIGNKYYCAACWGFELERVNGGKAFCRAGVAAGVVIVMRCLWSDHVFFMYLCCSPNPTATVIHVPEYTNNISISQLEYLW